jgi:hypothetical protein
MIMTLIDAYVSKSSEITMQFSIFPLKTPQLIGIICGCMVFIVTISVVIYLLFASGTIKGFLEEMRDTSATSTTKSPSKPHLESFPRLHDHLLDARKSLPNTVTIAPMQGKKVSLKSLDNVPIQDLQFLLEACNGSPQYEESAYDPLRLWTWVEEDFNNTKKERPWDNMPAFADHMKSVQANTCHVVISDLEVKKPIGMVTIFDNNVKNLSLRLGTNRCYNVLLGRSESSAV